MQERWNRKEWGAFFLILTLQAVLVLGFASQKIDFHVDECLTYALANHIDGLTLTPTVGKLVDSSVFTNFFAVTNGHQFDYTMVWENQTNDVHPPLYYVFIHTISSFIPQIVFSKWVGVLVNLLFGLLGSFMLVLIGQELFKKRAIGLAIAVLYAITPGFINASVFLRMYMMATFWFLYLAYVHIKQGQKECKKDFYLKIFVVSVLGALTHYYYLIFLFFMAVYFGMRLFLQKRFKETLFYALSLGAAGGVSIAIFPAMIEHIFFGYRGTASMDYLVQSTNLITRFKTFYEATNMQLFGGSAFLIIGVGIVFFIFEQIKIKSTVQRVIGHPFAPVLVATLCYFVLVSKSAPVLADRYVFPIYPFLFLISVSLLIIICQNFFSKRATFVAVAVIILITSGIGYKKEGVPYLYRAQKPILNLAKSYADRVCVIVYDTPHILLPSYEEFKNYKGLIFIPVDQLDLLDSMDLEQYGDILVYVTKYVDPTIVLNQIKSQNKSLDEADGLLNEEAFYVYHMK